MKNVNAEISIHEILTRREIEITKLIAKSYTDKQIAHKLCRSYHTIRTHHKNILNKTGQHSIGGLICFAMQKGLKI